MKGLIGSSYFHVDRTSNCNQTLLKIMNYYKETEDYCSCEINLIVLTNVKNRFFFTKKVIINNKFRIQ